MISRQLLSCLALGLLASCLAMGTDLVNSGINEEGNYEYDDCFGAVEDHSYCLHVSEEYSSDKDPDREWPVLLLLSGRGTRAFLEDASSTTSLDGVGEYFFLCHPELHRSVIVGQAPSWPMD